MTIYELTHFKKMVQFWKTKSLLFCLRYDPPIIFQRQNHITFIFIQSISYKLLVQMASQSNKGCYYRNLTVYIMHFNSLLMYYTMVAGLKLCNNTVQTGSFTTAQSQ